MNQPFVPGVDPRKGLKRHRERGPKRFTYTYDDLARLLWMKPATLRAWVWGGKLDPRSLEAICSLHAERRRA